MELLGVGSTDINRKVDKDACLSSGVGWNVEVFGIWYFVYGGWYLGIYVYKDGRTYRRKSVYI